MDYGALGLRCGLEIHQQLDTHKLFCHDRSDLSEDVTHEFVRRLRPTQSELGEVDAAAIEEAKRNLAFVYQATPNSCLVEADEEPPHPCNDEALDVVLTMALLLNAHVLDEVHFMRKIVIDGSNTTGFQRSALVATDGWFELDGKRYGVPTILLEEDAARKVEERDGEVVYRLDRLGVPLIEISTTPDVETPEELADVAKRIGTLLRATRRVRRGIGTIREDLNVSLAEGERTETKGVSELRMVATYAEREVGRQRMLIHVRDELRDRAVSRLPGDVQDLSELFEGTTSGVLRRALDAGGRALAVRLPGFVGLLKGMLGPELAARARIAGVRGILHSDELPGHGVTADEVRAVRTRLSAEEGDAFALVADREDVARAAMAEVVARAAQAIVGVPPETRDPRPDGTTVYSRPLAGGARMYPETDVPPIRIVPERLERIREGLPELPEIRVGRMVSTYGIAGQQAAQLVEDGYDRLFEDLAGEFKDAQVVANALTYAFSELRNEALPIDDLPDARIREVFAVLDEGAFAKEAVPHVLRRMVTEGGGAQEAADALGLAAMADADVDAVLAEIVAAHGPMIRERGDRALGTLMGLAMQQLRGKVDGRVVNEKLRALLRGFVR